MQASDCKFVEVSELWNSLTSSRHHVSLSRWCLGETALTNRDTAVILSKQLFCAMSLLDRTPAGCATWDGRHVCPTVPPCG